MSSTASKNAYSTFCRLYTEVSCSIYIVESRGFCYNHYSILHTLEKIGAGS